MSVEDGKNVSRREFPRPAHAPSPEEVDKRNAMALEKDQEKIPMLSEVELLRNAEEIAKMVLEEKELTAEDMVEAKRLHSRTLFAYSIRDLGIILRDMPNMKKLSDRYAYIVAKTYLDRLEEHRQQQHPL